MITTLGLMPARWLILTGLGTRDGGDDERIRRGFGAAARRASESGASSLAAALPDGLDASAVSAAIEGIALALYRFPNYKSTGALPGTAVTSVELWSAATLPEGAVAHGEAVASGVALARDLVNTTSNDKTPP